MRARKTKKERKSLSLQLSLSSILFPLFSFRIRSSSPWRPRSPPARSRRSRPSRGETGSRRSWPCAARRGPSSATASSWTRAPGKNFFFVCFRERGFEVIFPLLFSFSLSLKRKKRQSNQIESKSPHHDVAADGLDRGPGEHRPAVEVGGDDLEFFFLN